MYKDYPLLGPRIDIHNEMLLKIFKVACFFPVMCKLHAGSLSFILYVFKTSLQNTDLLLLHFQVVEKFWGISWNRMGSEDPVRYVKVAFY